MSSRLSFRVADTPQEKIFRKELYVPTQEVRYSVIGKPLEWNAFFAQKRGPGNKKITSKHQLVVQTTDQKEVLKSFKISKKYFGYFLSGKTEKGKELFCGGAISITVERKPKVRKQVEPEIFSLRGEERKNLAVERYHSRKKDPSVLKPSSLESDFERLSLSPREEHVEDSASDADMDEELVSIEKQKRNGCPIVCKQWVDWDAGSNLEPPFDFSSDSDF